VLGVRSCGLPAEAVGREGIVAEDEVILTVIGVGIGAVVVIGAVGAGVVVIGAVGAGMTIALVTCGVVARL